MSLDSLKQKAEQKYTECNNLYLKLQKLPMDQREKFKEEFEQLHLDYLLATQEYNDAVRREEQNEVNQWAEYWTTRNFSSESEKFEGSD